MSEWSPGPAWLFCPATRPDRYLKARNVADVVVLDLEDAVPDHDKPAARDAVRHLLDGDRLDLQGLVLRVNGADTVHFDADVALVRELGVRRIMLAKAERPDVAADLDFDVIPLVESPRGVLAVDELAGLPRSVAVMWGADDLVAGLGGTSSRHEGGSYRDVVTHARSRSLLAAKAHGRLAIDAVHMDISDLDGLATACNDASAIGFDVTVAIHPSQVPVIRASYAPSGQVLEWARRLLSQHDPADGVATFEGRMVDGPIFKQAQRVLRVAGES